MRYWLWMLLAVAAVVLQRDTAAADISSEQVQNAIDRGIEFLLEQKNPTSGIWTEHLQYKGGKTALATLALLNAGVEPDDPRLTKALGYLRGLKLTESPMTYSVALQTMVLCRATPVQDALLIQRNVRWLEKTQIQDGSRKGSWSYPGSAGDNSNAQFALLALHDAERAGVTVRPETWRLAKAYWEDCQNEDGSWGYYKGVEGTGSMTCAGITSLVIASDMVQQADARVLGEQIQCCQRAESANDRIQRGLEWMAAHFSVDRNPTVRGAGNAMWVLYYLYGLERVGRMTNHRFIGKHDWYREGAAALLRRRGQVEALSSWTGTGMGENDPVVGTCFALLFLSKGRWPILVSKLKYGQGEDWNQHRSDIANLTRYIEGRWKRDMVWQVMDVNAATVEDLVQSPVLSLAGSQSPLAADAAAQDRLARKIRDYVDRGGFLFAEAYCGGEGFDQGFRALMKKVFPEPEYALRLLPPEHPIWYAEQRVDPDYLRPLWGVEYGCRTSVVYCPPTAGGRAVPSLSCLWELSRVGREKKYPAAVERHVQAGLAMGINVMAYATNRELRNKEIELPTRPGAATRDTVQRGKFYIASLRHPGGCTAAPRALSNLLEWAGQQQEITIPVSTETREIPITDPALFDYHMVFMHGRNAFHLTDSERRQLALYVQRGGLVLANSICANRAFAESFRREMATIFPKNRLEPIPARDDLFTRKYGGFNLSAVKRRDPQGSRTGKEPLKALTREGPPEMEGIKFADRWGVIFSPLDLSCALERHDSLECQGYMREDAARIGMNVLLYSLQE